LVVTGIVIAVANMVLAWTIMFTHPTVPSQSQAPGPAKQETAAGQADSSMQQVYQIFQPVFRQAELKQISEQNVLRLGIAFSFALLSVGFSLFVMGIEGALSVSGEVPDLAKLVIRTASPGVLCIVLATAVITTLLVLTQVTFGDTKEAAQAELVRAEAEAKTQQTLAEESARLKRALDEDNAKFQQKMEEDKIKFERQVEQEKIKFERQLELERVRGAAQNLRPSQTERK